MNNKFCTNYRVCKIDIKALLICVVTTKLFQLLSDKCYKIYAVKAASICECRHGHILFTYVGTRPTDFLEGTEMVSNNF